MRSTPASAAEWVVAERAERVSLVEDRVRDWATASLSFCGILFTEKSKCQKGQKGITCFG